jgi:hypothetical protein
MAYPTFSPEELASERWLPVAEAPDLYEVSSLGRVRRALNAPRRQRSRPGQILRLTFNSSGYPYVNLSWGDGRRRTIQVARLVAAAFLPPPKGATQRVKRANGDPADCRASNLAWVNYAGGHRPRRTWRKYPPQLVHEILSQWGKVSRAELAQRYGLSVGAIDYIWNRIGDNP